MDELTNDRKSIIDIRTLTKVTDVTFLDESQDVIDRILKWTETTGVKTAGYLDVLELDQVIEHLQLRYVDYFSDDTFEFDIVRVKKLIDIVIKMNNAGFDKVKIESDILNSLKKQ